MSSNLNIIMEQANSAILSRDYDFAEKILLNQLKKTKKTPDEYYKLKTMLGKLYIRSGEIKKGLEVYKELNSLNPNDVEILNNLGVIYRHLELYNESVVILEKAKAIDSKNETTLYNLGNTYKQKGDYQQALKSFLKVLEIKPDDALAYNHLGSVYFLCKEYQKALDAYKIGLKVDPNHPFLNFNLAELYKTQKLYKEAVNSYQAALKTKPNWYDALVSIADCYVEMGELQKAIETYKTIIDSNGKSENSLTKLAELYEKNNEYKKAEDFYKKAISLNEYFLPAVLDYSNMLKSQKRYFDAYNILINNKDKHADNKELMLSTADVCLMLEDYSKAKEILNNLSAKIKGDKEILKMQGKLFSVLGDTKKAEQIFEHLLQISPSEINLRSELADLYLHNDKYKEAADELTKYLNEKPQEISARLKLGQAYEQMQKYDLAKNEYNKIIKNDSKNTDALTAILKLNEKEGNTADAVKLANDIVDIQTDNMDNDNINSLSESVQLYEDAVRSYGNDGILNKNLEKLRPPQEELDMSLEPEFNEPGDLNFENDEELTLSESFESMPDLEMPFNDLIELADDEAMQRDEDDESLESLVYVDAPIDDSPELKDEYETLEFGSPLGGNSSKNDIPEEEFRLPDTFAPAQNESKPQNPQMPKEAYQEPYNENFDEQPYRPQQRMSPQKPDADIAPQSAVSLEEPEDIYADSGIQKEAGGAANPVHAPKNSSGSSLSKPQEELNTNDKGIDKPSRPLLEDTPESIDETPELSLEVPEDNEDNDYAIKTDAESAPDSLIPSSFEDPEKSSLIGERKNDNQENLYSTALPHNLKKSPQFEEELDTIESYEIVKLFVYLRDMMDNLPAADLKDFLISNERIQMEYVINKLSGDVGLKRRMILINVKDTLKKAIEPKSSTDKTLKDVLGYLRIVASKLPDKGFASACIIKIDNLIKQIG